ncbi:hypothetical protein TEA_015433 [Camellia sinensis var. sinensis]|uniref:Acyl carrier protein n=1 Tax=Camellia sinensis var. sinensis TaxID=542762 RepID=A0A4S4D2R6_CAMSN|nr:hypothetical protein TEA_015433 [Camellia sinensis var. sinensis]
MSSSSDYNLYLPMDIIFDILNRLPVKSLPQFRCVCKTFRHLISNPTFISSHLLHHRTPTTAATIAFVMLPRLDFSGFYDGTSVHWKLMDWKENAVVVVWSWPPMCDVTTDVHFQNDLGLDSFDNVEIVLALEEKFELEIPNKETNKIDSCFLAIE